MHHPILVEIYESLEELKHDRLDSAGWNGVSVRLGVMMDDLKQVVFRVLENNVYAFLLEDNLDSMDDIWMSQFHAQSHLTDSRL